LVGALRRAISELKTAKELSGNSTEPVKQLGYALAKSGATLSSFAAGRWFQAIVRLG